MYTVCMYSEQPITHCAAHALRRWFFGCIKLATSNCTMHAHVITCVHGFILMISEY